MESFEYPLFIKIFDADVLGSDEFLGGLNIDINEGIQKGYISINSKEAKPTWLDLKYDKFSDIGNILVSFYISEKDYDQSLNLKENPIKVELEPYNLNLKVLGLRNL